MESFCHVLPLISSFEGDLHGFAEIVPAQKAHGFLRNIFRWQFDGFSNRFSCLNPSGFLMIPLTLKKKKTSKGNSIFRHKTPKQIIFLSKRSLGLFGSQRNVTWT